MKPEEVTEIRSKLGVTQEKFAQMLGTTVSTVNKWENGKAKPSRMSIKELKELGARSGSYACRRKELENA